MALAAAITAATIAQETTAPQSSLFSYEQWSAQLPSLTERYRSNQPCRHILLEDFVSPALALRASQEFPGPSTQEWIHYKHQNENKLGFNKREAFPLALGQLTDELNSPEFVAWLSKLTGIAGLMPDPSLEGGGLHQSTRGGFLNIHADFSMHHYHKNWRRRVNLILYLNPDWEQAWGGALELWDKQMTACLAKYPPLLNHALIFDTNEESLHGFPDALQCPDNASRKSLALYYYTVDNDAGAHARSTDYRARPSDGVVKSALIWLDKIAVDLYSRAKARFGFSDDLASRILGMFSKK
jgi:Rps23 Pro-64 3,4-dihydroxylase Tpa1-like proline 4-hydroxylase